MPTVLDGLKQLMSELSQRGRKLSRSWGTEADAQARRGRSVDAPACGRHRRVPGVFRLPCRSEAAKLVAKIVAKGRKYGVTLPVRDTGPISGVPASGGGEGPVEPGVF
ncbi:hypothetical protein, partial [Pseudonocardia sp. ICBG1142]|uniref:hypothetical protein n=1 Tax=Pseudonocardia sp. ICBG1142 TaxID=2846760 RepID=UPI001CF6093D